MSSDKIAAGTALCDFFLHCEENTINITIVGVDDKGQLSFSFPVSDIKNKSVVDLIGADGDGITGLGFFYTDMMGNLIVRKNLKKFWHFFVSMSDSEYNERVLKYDHVHFGAASNGTYVSMIFHCSLLYDIFIRMVDNCTAGN